MDLSGLTARQGLRLIARILEQLARGEGELDRGLDAYLRTPASGPDRAALARIAAREYRARRERVECFPSDLFGEPAWDILLDLYVSEAAGRPVSVTDACIASAVPLTTGLRWIDVLERAGMLTRRSDERDRRRAFLGLSDKGRECLDRYLAGRASSTREALPAAPGEPKGLAAQLG